MMTTREIDRAEWREFFDAFSRQHARWLVLMEVLGRDFGAQVEANAVCFEGLSTDFKDGENAIALTLGEEADAHITHVVQRPTHVRIARSDSEVGTFETLEIEAADGSTTLVRFLAGVVPVMLDGVVERGGV